MRWALLLVVVLGCGNKEPPKPEHADDIEQMNSVSDTCWARNTDLVLMNWEEIPEYVGIRPRVVEWVQSDDAAVLIAVGGVATQCGDLETLTALARRSPKSPTETRTACRESSEFFDEYQWACSTALGTQTLCCDGERCRDRKGCASFCAWGCQGAPEIPR